ncbi:hypothetical protein GCM10009794_15090 [Rothia terrae]
MLAYRASNPCFNPPVLPGLWAKTHYVSPPPPADDATLTLKRPAPTQVRDAVELKATYLRV